MPQLSGSRFITNWPIAAYALEVYNIRHTPSEIPCAARHAFEGGTNFILFREGSRWSPHCSKFFLLLFCIGITLTMPCSAICQSCFLLFFFLKLTATPVRAASRYEEPSEPEAAIIKYGTNGYRLDAQQQSFKTICQNSPFCRYDGRIPESIPESNHISLIPVS